MKERQGMRNRKQKREQEREKVTESEKEGERESLHKTIPSSSATLTNSAGHHLLELHDFRESSIILVLVPQH